MAGVTASTILVVDDETKHLIALSRHITNALPTFCVRVCNEKQKALYYVEQMQPHIVIIDNEMPTMDGLTIAQAITTRWPKTRIIVMTDVATPDIHHAAQIAGCTAVITKSLAPTVLASLIEQTLCALPRQPSNYEIIAAQ